MMPLRLEVFDDEDRFAAATPEDLLDAETVDELRLASFDTGYRAGWDDAVAATTDAEATQRDEIARHLQGLSFTYHEARSHVLRALSPLIADIAARLLPEIARSALPQLVADALGPYAELAVEAPVELLANPATRPRLEAMLGTDPGLPLTCRDDPELSPGQVWLRLGETETRIDIDAALTAIRTVLADFFDPHAKDSRHG